MENKLNLTDINITPIKAEGGLVGFASTVVNNQIYFGCIAIHTSLSSPGGFRLVFPTKVLSNGSQLSIVHPISKEAGAFIQKAVVSEYRRLITELAHGNKAVGPRSRYVQ